MRAQEFRLGNLYHFEDVSGMVVEKVDYIENDMIDANPMDLIHPIPLTEEWLLKFGFEPNIYNDEFELYPLTFDCEYTDEGNWNIIYDSYPLSTEIKHVHQLQNLYFALTGEELTIKNEDK